MSITAYLTDLIAARDLRCNQCGRNDALFLRLTVGGQHYARIECTACADAFVTWAPKPTARPKPVDRRKSQLDALRAHYDPEPLYCLICLRDERTFPTGVWLEAHHILEHQDGGTDHPANLQALCNECHTLVHWRRKTAAGTQVGKEATDA